MMRNYIDAEPYPWPFDKRLRPDNTALVIVDMQRDFCSMGGYIDQAGVDVNEAKAAVASTERVLNAVRSVPGILVVFTRLCFRADLANTPAHRLWRSRQMGVGIGDSGPLGRHLVSGEPGAEIVPELAPAEGEVVVDKPGLGAFYGTDLEPVLRHRQVRNLVIAGVTADVCVHATMFEANDRGYECLLLKDCTIAAKASNYSAVIDITTMQHGLVGAVSTSQAAVDAVGSV